MTDPGFNDYRARLTETLEREVMRAYAATDDLAAVFQMPPDGAPLALGFADLFDHLGTDALRYSAAARELSGRDVAIEGFLSHPHGPRAALLLVDQPGLCPDCSPVPAAVITLLGAPAFRTRRGTGPVRVVGRLDYGFRIDDGIASMLRIEPQDVLPHKGQA